MANNIQRPEQFPKEVSEYLAKLETEERARVESLFRQAVTQSGRLEIEDLWDHTGAAVSYWILIATGVNHQEEMAVALSLLSWKAFFANSTAWVRCIQTSDRQAFDL